ncbi:helix-turn-helix domain-containing protein [Telluria beijingensis]|uniref:helix-turn-helix domain-containing protein n=1 Tax=Telluria beijingensis TaxID=3068633 RepID=UPI002795C09C|nr:helix-turn-helix domain-containing protein [Massilia sp. REN29]
MSQITAEVVYKNFTQLATSQRAKFFALLAEASVRSENFSHDDVFGHLAGDKFTAVEAAKYLEVSMSTFRRHVAQGRIQASSKIGRSQLFSTKVLKAFKRSLQDVKARNTSRMR